MLPDNHPAIVAYEAARDALQEAGSLALRERVAAIQARLPRRHVQFIDSMGLCFVVIDNRVAATEWPDRLPIIRDIAKLEMDVAEFGDLYRVQLDSIG